LPEAGRSQDLGIGGPSRPQFFGMFPEMSRGQLPVSGACPGLAGTPFKGRARMAKEHTSSSLTKYFVLDTNVLLPSPNSLFAFAENHVIIPFDVLEELDKFKKDSTDVGRSARTAIRHLDGLREKGHLTDGVRWNGHGGTITVRMNAKQEGPPGLAM